MYSVVIPTYGVKGIMMVKDLLASMTSFNNPNLNEIIISDDGTTIDTLEQLTQLEHPQLKIVLNPPYYSFSKTVNSGLAVSNPADDILLLNNDMIALTSFEPFRDFALNTPKAGIIGGKLLTKNLKIQFTGMVKMKYMDTFRFAYKNKNYDYSLSNVPQKFMITIGACQYLKRDLINKIGYLNELYINGHEDLDYCLTAQLNGYDVWYTPDVMLIHYGSVTRNKLNDEYNKKLFWGRWRGLYNKIRIKQGLQNDYIDANVAKSSIIAGMAYLIIK